MQRAAQSCDKKAAAMDMNADADVNVDGDGVSEIPHSFISIHSISVENRVCAVFSLFTWHENVGVWSESCHSHFKRAASRSQR